jgi:hypothetical protein
VDSKELLFDNKLDPYQMSNRIADPEYAEVLSELRGFMAQKMAEINDNFEPSSWYEQNWTEDRIIMKTASIQ